MKRILVNGAGGFIGGHLVKRLKAEGNWVRGVDLKYPEFDETAADEFVIGYGLDYAEKFRNLPFIGTLAPHVYGGAGNT